MVMKSEVPEVKTCTHGVPLYLECQECGREVAVVKNVKLEEPKPPTEFYSKLEERRKNSQGNCPWCKKPESHDDHGPVWDVLKAKCEYFFPDGMVKSFRIKLAPGNFETALTALKDIVALKYTHGEHGQSEHLGCPGCIAYNALKKIGAL